MACPNCGTANDLERTFCISCGELLRPVSDTAPVVATAPSSRLPIGGRQAIAGLAVVGIAVVLLALFLGPLATGPAATTSPSQAAATVTAAATASPTVAPSASVVASASLPPPSSAPPSVVPTGTIVYANNDAGDDDIYIRDLDDSEATRVVDRNGNDTDPDLSSDGSRIAWGSPQGIRIADIDSGDGWLFTHQGLEDQSPAWSPDDETIAFASSRDGDFDIYLRPVIEGTTKLTQLTTSPKADLEPAWAPNGREIVFTRGEGKASEIMLIDLVTRKVTRLTKNNDRDIDPTWSPDGESIAFASDKGDGYDVYTMVVETRKVTRLTSDGAGNQDPVWSPDGLFIAYQARADGAAKDLFIVDAATGDVVRQFEDPGTDRWASWR